jgi:P4 family phage/plasmid primase-like protien
MQLNPLTPADLRMFARLGIPEELLIEAGVERVTDAEARDYGITGTVGHSMAGIVFPYFDPDTAQRVTARIRRDNPEIEDGKPKNKYISAYGDRKHLFFPPRAARLLRDADTPIVLVEAEKSSLAITAWAERTGQKAVAVGTGGCWGWRGRIGKLKNARGERVDEMGPLSDLSKCDGRRVYVVLDYCANNLQVRQARNALARELQKRKCEVLVCDIPAIDSVNGPDDLLAVRGDAALSELLAAGKSPEVEFMDDMLASRFTAKHDDLRFTAEWGYWSQWDGVCWVRKSAPAVFDLARLVCREAAAESPEIARKITGGTVATVEKLARGDSHHLTALDQWDSDPWLLNTPGGVVDLRTGVLRAAKREDYCTKVTAVAPGECAECPQWMAFLDRITAGQVELQQFMQRMCGYTLTGTTREHALFFLYGTGANGKSVFLNTISSIMGDYVRAAPVEAFIASPTQSHPTDLAGLQGARLVTAVETEDGRRWAESKLKALTGGDRIAARFMRQDYFEFTPQFKLVIAGNHKPGLRTVDEAMRRRLNLLPFTVTIPAAERDAELTEKLRAEWSGILQWMIDGCLAWQREGLNAPGIVRDATEKYLSAEDTPARWMEDCCVLSRACWTSASALFGSWEQWCEQNHEYPGAQKRFSESLESRGFQQVRTRAARGFTGIGLVTDVTGPPVIRV